MTNRFTKGFYIVRFEYADFDAQRDCCYTKLVYAENIEELHKILDRCEDDAVDYWEASTDEMLRHRHIGDVL